MARIRINGIDFDPLNDPSPEAQRGEDANTNHVLVQTGGPLQDEDRARLDAAGVTIHEYVGGNTYLCAYTGGDLEKIRSVSGVVWAGVYPVRVKIAPSLGQDGDKPSMRVRGRADLPTPGSVEVDIVLHADVPPGSGDLTARVAEAAHVAADDIRTGRRKYRLVTERRYLDDIAAIEEVREIEEVLEVGATNNVAGQIIHSHVVVNGTTYEGAGEVIAVADTGFDIGSRTNVHPAFAGRVDNLYPLGRPNMSNDPVGHGTHVAGSALGDGNAPTMGGAIRGTAPQAHLVLQSLLDNTNQWGGIPTDLHDLFRPPYDNDNARVHTNSWGVLTPGVAYTQRSREIDDFAWTHQDLVILFSANNFGTDSDGNGIVDPGQLGAESAAKNAITVGASESNRGSSTDKWDAYGDKERPTVEFHTNPIKDDLVCNNAAGMAPFSSRGPTQEGRIKPDVVAPGTCILSTRSRALANAASSWGNSTDNGYWFLAGTSMSTPLVAGCCAVLRETLVRNGWVAPPSALIKAILINGALELAGQYPQTEAGRSPNPSSGWGLVDLAGSVIIPGPSPDAGIGTGGPLKQGQEDTFHVKVPGSTFKVTLIWTDPPGRDLQNDLDLIVRASNGDEYHGNIGPSKEQFDTLNNVEQVYWEHVPSGDLEIIIRATRITQFPQPYAWAWRLWS